MDTRREDKLKERVREREESEDDVGTQGKTRKCDDRALLKPAFLGGSRRLNTGSWARAWWADSGTDIFRSDDGGLTWVNQPHDQQAVRCGRAVSSSWYRVADI